MDKECGPANDPIVPTHRIETVRLGWLRTFAVVMRCGSQISAAVELNSSQSNISRRIEHLEDWLGEALLAGSQRRVSTTRAREILPQIEKIDARLITWETSGGSKGDLSLSWLMAFASGAQCGSFSDAAHLLGWSKQHVGYAIRQLERWLGAKLFIENAASGLTSEGQRFLIDAQAVLAMANSLRSPEAAGRRPNSVRATFPKSDTRADKRVRWSKATK